MKNEFMKQRNQNIDILRGIAILFIILSHVLPMEYTIHYVIDAINIPAFFLISGYLFYLSYERKSSVGEFVKNKAIHLLIPYCSWSLLSIAVKWIVGGDWTIKNLFYLMRFIIIQAGTVWFFLSLFIMYVMLIAGIFLSDKYCKVFGIIPYVLILFCPDNILGMHYTKWLYPFLVVGYWLAKYEKNIKQYLQKGKYIYWVGIILSVVTGGISYRFNLFEWNKLHYVAGFLIVAILCVAFVYYNIIPLIVKNTWMAKHLTSFGKNTMAIYPISMLFTESIMRKCVSNLPFYVEMRDGDLNSRIFFSIMMFLLSWIIVELCIVLDKLFRKVRIYSILFMGEITG